MRVREISDDEGNRLKRIVRRGSGSVVTWRRAQMVLWPAQGMSVTQVAGLAFTSEDRVRDVLHNFNADGFESLYALAGGEAAPGPGDPDVIICVDEFGPLNLQPRPGRQWARRGGTARDPGEAPRRRLRATYHRTGGVRHLFAALELGTGQMYGHIKKRKRRGEFLQFCRYLRGLHPPQVRIAIVCDNFSPHLSTRRDTRAGQRAAASNVEIAYTPTNCSWMNRFECQFTASREFTLNGTDHATHREQGSMIRRYIAWRNRHTADPRLWPDGGWNCDPAATGRRSSFHESLAPAWGLHEYGQAAGDPAAQDAASRAAGLFLAHRLFRSLADGRVIYRAWLAPHYPPYWYYDIGQALLILSRMGKASDPRAGDALDELERRRLPDGRWQPGGRWWKPPGSTITPEVVDWGRSGPSEMITLNALRVLKASGRLT